MVDKVQDQGDCEVVAELMLSIIGHSGGSKDSMIAIDSTV